MHQILIDGAAYGTYPTLEEAEAARATLRRWSSTSTRIAVVPVAAVPCDGCDGTGTALRRAWVGARGGWVSAPGPCRACSSRGSAPATTAPVAA